MYYIMSYYYATSLYIIGLLNYKKLAQIRDHGRGLNDR